VAARLTRRELGERRRRPRRVWRNPVAWREARSRATAVTKGFMNFVLMGGGLIAAIVLFLEHVGSGDAATTRGVLSVIIAVEMALILLAATNTAATAMTKDKESQTMDLLLATPLTSRYIVWGKLRGLVTFTVPLICIPGLTMLLFGIHGLFAPESRVVPIEAALAMPAAMLSYAAAACMFGLWISLHNRSTVRAVMISVGVVVFVCLVLTLIFRSIVEGAGIAGAFFAPLTPFTGVLVMTDPLRLFDSPSEYQSGYLDARVWMALGSAAACLAYLAAVGGGYKSMVRNFDMIMRKQSAQM
jgi:ABC-type transport system involved in multi-copper enzyme maturation permease subunit